MEDRFRFRVWYDPQSEYLQPRYFYDVQDIYEGSIDGLNWICCFGDFFNNDQYVIEQCTGLKDKNGKLIYEGDVVRTVTGAIGVVVFYEDWAGFIVRFENISTCNVVATQEVIGNIHENK